MKYYCHIDAGHGWLAVKRTELQRLGLIGQISSCSYQKGGTVYLEEDCDAGLFLNAKKQLNETVTFKESYQEHSTVRSYPYFSYTEQEELDNPETCATVNA